MVLKALSLGYTHLDMAWLFPSHRDLKKTFPDIPRDKYKVIMKVMPGQDITPVLKSFEGYVDVMLVHWPGVYSLKPEDPQNEVKRHEHFRKLEDLQRLGDVGEIGLSNFNHSHIEKLLKVCEVKPKYNEFELHPLYLEK